jgi:hypothetical protein
LQSQRLRPWCQGESLWAADKDLVAEQCSQSGQAGAHRGLADVQPLRRTGYVPLVKERLQGDKEVEVEAAEIHAVDGSHKGRGMAAAPPDFYPRPRTSPRCSARLEQELGS